MASKCWARINNALLLLLLFSVSAKADVKERFSVAWAEKFCLVNAVETKLSLTHMDLFAQGGKSFERALFRFQTDLAALNAIIWLDLVDFVKVSCLSRDAQEFCHLWLDGRTESCT